MNEVRTMIVVPYTRALERTVDRLNVALRAAFEVERSKINDSERRERYSLTKFLLDVSPEGVDLAKVVQRINSPKTPADRKAFTSDALQDLDRYVLLGRIGRTEREQILDDHRIFLFNREMALRAHANIKARDKSFDAALDERIQRNVEVSRIVEWGASVINSDCANNKHFRAIQRGNKILETVARSPNKLNTKGYGEIQVLTGYLGLVVAGLGATLGDGISFWSARSTCRAKDLSRAGSASVLGSARGLIESINYRLFKFDWHHYGAEEDARGPGIASTVRTNSWASGWNQLEESWSNQNHINRSIATLAGMEALRMYGRQGNLLEQILDSIATSERRARKFDLDIAAYHLKLRGAKVNDWRSDAYNQIESTTDFSKSASVELLMRLNASLRWRGIEIDASVLSQVERFAEKQELRFIRHARQSFYGLRLGDWAERWQGVRDRDFTPKSLAFAAAALRMFPSEHHNILSSLPEFGVAQKKGWQSMVDALSDMTSRKISDLAIWIEWYSLCAEYMEMIHDSHSAVISWGYVRELGRLMNLQSVVQKGIREAAKEYESHSARESEANIDWIRMFLRREPPVFEWASGS